MERRIVSISALVLSAAKAGNALPAKIAVTDTANNNDFFDISGSSLLCANTSIISVRLLPIAQLSKVYFEIFLYYRRQVDRTRIGDLHC
jgi:hypothetical protein